VPTIPNFPQALLDQHHHWHVGSAHPELGPGRANAAGSPGGGLEFLTFHRNFMAQFMAWYNATSFGAAPFNDPGQKASLVAAWTTVPNALKQASLGWNATWASDANRLDTGTPDFASADALGTFIEVGIHNNFLHGASASNFGESTLNGFHSPQSSYFYKIHGLVDYWWSRWQMRHKRLIKELAIEVKPRFREVLKQPAPEVKRRIEEVKLLAREVFDPPEFEEVVNPPVRALQEVAADSLADRLTRLEAQVFPMSAAFIRANERPAVAQHLGEEDTGDHGGGGHG